MFVDFIESIRKKPGALRARIAMLAIGVTMIVVLNLWVFNLQHLLARHGIGDDQNAPEAIREEVVEITRDTPSLVASVKNGFGVLVSQLKDISEQQNSEVIVPDDPEPRGVQGEEATDELEQVTIEPRFEFEAEEMEAEDETFDSFLDIYDEYYQ